MPKNNTKIPSISSQENIKESGLIRNKLDNVLYSTEDSSLASEDQSQLESIITSEQRIDEYQH